MTYKLIRPALGGRKQNPLKIWVENNSGETLELGAPIHLDRVDTGKTRGGELVHYILKVGPATETVAVLCEQAEDEAVVQAFVGGKVKARVDVQNTDDHWAAVDRTNRGTAFVSVGNNIALDSDYDTCTQGRSPILRLLQQPSSTGVQDLDALMIPERKHLHAVCEFSGSVTTNDVIPLTIVSGDTLPGTSEGVSLSNLENGQQIDIDLKGMRGVYAVHLDFAVDLPVSGDGICTVGFLDGLTEDVTVTVPTSVGTETVADNAFRIPVAATRIFETAGPFWIRNNSAGTVNFTNGRLSITRIGPPLQSNV